jgi:hypothetical protein
MHSRHVLGLLVVVAGLACLGADRVEATPPWLDMISLNRVEADPAKSYRLTPENGPWLVMACSFSGEQAEQQAKELVLELRRRYKLEAYVHRVSFDLGSETYGRGIDRYGQPMRMRYRRPQHFDEIAVMVGDYPTVDAPAAQRTLRKIKHSRPDCLKLDPNKPTARNLAAWRTLTRYTSPEREKMGPMSKAFVTTNPLLPKEYFAPRGVDRLVEQMNAGVEHSLLDCPGRYTVQVAQFNGSMVSDQAKIREIEEGKGDLKSNLAKAALAAHKLTQALRIKGYEAYEFHDRAASIVTIGSFNSVGTPRADGKIEINPQIHAIMERFKALPPKTPGGGPEARALVGIPFDPQPIPVEVPRRAISADYRADAVGMR